MISEVLGEDVPFKVVQRLWSREFETLDDVRQAANLVYRLCQASVTDNALSMAEKGMIRKDAAWRLLFLARPQIRDVRAWEILGLACRLDPLVIGRAARKWLRRVVRE